MGNHAAMAVVLGGVLAATAGCAHRIERKTGRTMETVDLAAPFLKAHMKNGDLYVLSKWTIDEGRREIVGVGDWIGPDRRAISATSHRVTLADVALFETNTVVTSPGVAALAVVTGLSAAVTIACIANPKACFGSCPTFYATTDAGTSVLQAEGFSDAIAPSLETNDIDALWRTTGRAGPLTVTMTNEAYETHVVKAADLLVVPRPAGGRVLATADRLWSAAAVVAPIRCSASEGDCLATVRAVDAVERTSLTDPADLATRETIELGFAPVTTGRLAIVIGARQSLVTTFLLYQGLAYLGTTAGTWLAALERGDGTARAGGRALQGLIGGIRVQVERDGAWVTVGEASETGPLATDVHLVMLPPGVTGERLRLDLPQGSWRIDSVALATITGEARPTRIAPTTITGTLGPDYGKGRRAATTFPIVTMPGDAYELTYVVPPGSDEYEVFLDSRGYYLEWMREEWIREEQPLSALRLLLDSARMLRELAPIYKRLEADAEAVFWRSRYARP